MNPFSNEKREVRKVAYRMKKFRRLTSQEYIQAG